MKYILTCLLLLPVIALTANSSTDTLLQRLNNELKRATVYDADKVTNIVALRQRLQQNTGADINIRFENSERLYEEYKLFNYDSAFSYAKNLQLMAAAMQDPVKITGARLKMGFILLSSGMFKETMDSLETISINDAPDSMKAEYYTLMGRFYYDLGDFDNDKYHTPAYIKKGSQYIDSALMLYDRNSFNFLYYQGLRDLKSGNRETALTGFIKVMSMPYLSDHQRAVAASTLSDIYIQTGQTARAIELLIDASIADIRSSTKETAAIFNLAGLLFKQGDVKNASLYIEQALGDAVYYGARQRKVQVSAIMPLIEGEKLNRVETEKQVLIVYSTIATLLLLTVITLAVIILKQVNKLKNARQIITAAHAHQQEINYKLQEANKIKEEYIGFFFNANSLFFAKIEKFKKLVEQKISDRKIDEIKFLVNNINIKNEKDEHIRNFDKAFLKLFPNFVIEFNGLFKEEDQIHLKDDELLNTDLRIFALIRMGIHDNERIAQILEYSVNTIYTYKTRVKNRSLVPNEEFEDKIMMIRTV